MQILKLNFKLFLISLLFSCGVFASTFESFPEYTTLDEPEQNAFDSPQSLDSQYAPLSLSYQKPSEWNYYFAKSDKALDSTVGSIDGSHFLIQNRLKLRQKLSDSVEFRFTHFTEQDLERELQFNIFEMVYWLNPKIGFSAYGEPAFYKRKNDVGLAFLFKPETNHEIRLYNTFVDIVRNDRNDRRDRFESPDFPYAMGVTGRYYGINTMELLEYSLKYETKTRWVFPDEGYEYIYSRMLASINGIHSFSENEILFAQIQYDQKTEERTTGDNWKTQRVLSVIRYKQKPMSYGLAVNTRSWVHNQEPTTYVDFVPHGIFEIKGWSFEYDLTFHKRTAENSPMVNQRLDIGYEFAFNNGAALKLVTTWDVDHVFKNKPWGGGCGQFRTDF